MATKVELHKDELARIITSQIASLKRSKTKNTINTAMMTLIDGDINRLQNALNTMVDTK